MKHKTAVKKLMGYGMSRNEANKRLIEAHFLGLSNRISVLFPCFMEEEYIPNSIPYEIDKECDIPKKEDMLND